MYSSVFFRLVSHLGHTLETARSRPIQSSNIRSMLGDKNLVNCHFRQLESYSLQVLLSDTKYFRPCPFTICSMFPKNLMFYNTTTYTLLPELMCPPPLQPAGMLEVDILFTKFLTRRNSFPCFKMFSHRAIRLNFFSCIFFFGLLGWTRMFF